MEQAYINKKDLYNIIDADLADKIAKEVFNEEIGNLKTNSMYTTYTQNNKKYYVMTNKTDSSICCKCIDISNISYCDGVYTVEFTYVYMPDTQEDKDINDLDIYQNTVNFIYDENNKYSKFLISSKDKPIVIKSVEEKEKGDIKEIEIKLSENNDPVIGDNENEVENKEDVNQKINVAGTYSYYEVYKKDENGKLILQEDGIFTNYLPGASTLEKETTGTYTVGKNINKKVDMK